MPDPPILVYDDDCGFCTWAARKVAAHGPVEIVGFSALDADLRERLPAGYEDCAHLIVGDEIHSCGAAMEEAYRYTDLPGADAVSWARRLPGYEAAREGVYGFVSGHRYWFGRLRSERPPARER